MEEQVSGTVVAMDAPLLIPKRTGQRLCEQLVGQRYGSCGYPSPVSALLHTTPLTSTLRSLFLSTYA